MPTIVSVTILPVERDSRTYKQAASFARLGYESVVLEGRPSAMPRENLPFRLITLGGGPTPSPPPATGAGSAGGAPAEAAEPVGNPRARALAERLPGPLARLLVRIGGRLDAAWQRFAMPWVLWRSLRADNAQALAELPKADLYCLHYFWHASAVRQAAERHGAPFLYDAHDAYWEWSSFNWYPWRFAAYLRWVERRCVKRAAGFLTVSDGVADLLEKRFGRRPDVVRNCHDLRLDEPAESDVREATGAGEDAFLAVLVGNEKPGDAIEETLDALRTLPPRVHLVLLGAGYEKHEPAIAARGLGDRVHLLPPVAPTRVSATIATADVGLVIYRGHEANYQYALPNRFFHSVAAGLPVLYPPLTEIRALAERYGLGLEIDTERPESISEAVAAIAGDPEAEKRLRRNVESARRELNWEQEEKRLGDVVASILARSGAD